ncbi:phytase [Aurantiacibacter gangjinensis]|uniref:3-phytase n=1 Tax=Aurantiacibacter gangjinensis TaxID=502682 RepID=A0A0G9MM73_9SPHN|nr:phytase [Aurantiacibacter gangjinensis]APE27700.1 Phytase domain protein [Aurantiacibacter gangjinensis]KLE31709.1 3-phytase [Aurantiacibacter gangjinensis]
MRRVHALLPAALLAGCVTTPTGLPPVVVYAAGETVPVGTVNDDAADDPAIWRNPADPSQSLIVATDKKAGLYVYGLDGAVRSFSALGQVNNVDLVELPDGRVLVAASDRNDPMTAHIVTALLDTASGELTVLSRHSVGNGEGYGFCMAFDAATGMIRYFSAVKEGAVYLTSQPLEAGLDSDTTTTLFHTLPSQPEGCVHDPRTDRLYVGEEAGGIWVLDFETDTRELLAPIDNQYLVADVEGLALAPEGENGGYLIASSQGDNAYAVYRLSDMAPLGRFAIAQGEYGSAEETDGIALVVGDFGPDYPGGLFVAQDGLNAPNPQNFKLVAWEAIREALVLD